MQKATKAKWKEEKLCVWETIGCVYLCVRSAVVVAFAAAAVAVDRLSCSVSFDPQMHLLHRPQKLIHILWNNTTLSVNKCLNRNEKKTTSNQFIEKSMAKMNCKKKKISEEQQCVSIIRTHTHTSIEVRITRMERTHTCATRGWNQQDRCFFSKC